MAFHRTSKTKPKPRSPILLVSIAVTAITLLFLIRSVISTKGSLSFSSKSLENVINEKYLYWGRRMDCPGKHCESCEGLGHQESSLRCALEEAMYLQRWSVTYSTFVFSTLELFEVPFFFFSFFAPLFNSITPPCYSFFRSLLNSWLLRKFEKIEEDQMLFFPSVLEL